jgi:ABC-type sugar transport system ATPase subunit
MSNPLQDSPDQYALRMVNIDKYFGLVRALTSINLDVGRNEIVGLIGDNGAGKSTIVKILTGVFPPTSGELYIAGRKVDFRRYNVQSAHRHGIETVSKINRSAKNRSYGGTSSSGGRSSTVSVSLTLRNRKPSPMTSC